MTSASENPSQTELNALISNRKIIVCVGSGGVGKTTISAVVALHAALQGRKVLVLTIDPAKRLANSLGVSELDNDERQIPLTEFYERGVASKDGELWAMMLDMKRSFDHLVERSVRDQGTAQRILDNKLYHIFSTSLAGTQEYSAMERLYELYQSGRYDLIVLDTPPTVHALDFLDAPNRMAEAVETSALQWLYKPSVAAGKFGFGLFNIGTNYVLKTLSKITGSEFLQDLKEFLKVLSPMFDGLGRRARQIRKVIGSDETLFFIVTSPDPLTVDEARYFRNRLREEQIPLGGFIVNRVHQAYLDVTQAELTDETLAAGLAALGATPSATEETLRELSERLIVNAGEFQTLADLNAQTLSALHDRLMGSHKPLIAQVPFFSHDIHSFEGLGLVRRHLFNL